MNISEGGLAVTAAGMVLSDYFPRMRFQLGKSADWIEASGQVVWTSDSRKGIGIRFDGLPEVDREKIRRLDFGKRSGDDGPEPATGRGPEVKPFSQTRVRDPASQADAQTGSPKRRGRSQIRVDVPLRKLSTAAGLARFGQTRYGAGSSSADEARPYRIFRDLRRS